VSLQGSALRQVEGLVCVALAQVRHRQPRCQRRATVVRQEGVLPHVKEVRDGRIGVAGIEPRVGGVALGEPVVGGVAQVALEQVCCAGPLVVVKSPVGVGGKRLGIVGVDGEGLAEERRRLLRVTPSPPQTSPHLPLGLVPLGDPDRDQDGAGNKEEDSDVGQDRDRANDHEGDAQGNLRGREHGFAVDRSGGCRDLRRCLFDRPGSGRALVRRPVSVISGVAGVVDARPGDPDGATGPVWTHGEMRAPRAKAPADAGLREVHAKARDDGHTAPQAEVAHQLSNTKGERRGDSRCDVFALSRSPRQPLVAGAWEALVVRKSERMFLELWECDFSADATVGSRLVPCPPEVQPANLESFVRQMFGDPSDNGLANIDQFKGLMIGWIFPPEALQRLDPDAEASWELVVVPVIEQDGTLVRFFLAEARLREEFRAFYANNKLDHYAEITPPPIEYQGPCLEVLGEEDGAQFMRGGFEKPKSIESGWQFASPATWVGP
jgi:hypothetical protein